MRSSFACFAWWLVLVAALTSCRGRLPHDAVDDVSDAGVTPEPPPPRCAEQTGPGLAARPAGPRCEAPARPPQGGSVDLVKPWPDLVVEEPLLMLEEPGTDTMYVMQRRGRIVRFDKNDATVTTPETWGDIDDRVAASSGQGERGLLGMAFHPQWPAVDDVFFYYTAAGVALDYEDRLSRFHLDADGTLDEDSEEILVRVDDGRPNHNGGMIAFGKDGFLYAGLGDGGGPNDPDEHAQDLSTVLGKMLRIDVDHEDVGLGYAIPADNPLINVAGAREEVWAWGFRNPWRWSFDKETGEQWLGDVGQTVHEEIDVVVRGGNYGWDMKEGVGCSLKPEDAAGPCDTDGLVDPVVDYEHDGTRVAVMGGFVYRGAEIDALAGTYLFADFGSGEIFALLFDDDGAPVPLVVFDSELHIGSFAEDEDGELYVIAHDTNEILQLVPAGAPIDTDFPQTLSATGCVDPVDATRPAPGLLPYDVNHELWSDGASKERFLSLPEGASGVVGADGDIDLPIGTVLVKNFLVDGERTETRLLVRHDDGGWAGYSYEWNADGTDAVLVPAGGATRAAANGAAWNIPSRNGCLACHTATADRSLGVEVPQLNRAVDYAAFFGEQGHCANQLETWQSLGIVTLPSPSSTLPAFPARGDPAASAEDAARAYLHVNCAICHRPGGQGLGELDLRATVDVADMKICRVAPGEGDLGVINASLLAPGEPDRSLILLRMQAQGAGRMPPLATRVVDGDGAATIDGWIRSLTTCPE